MPDNDICTAENEPTNSFENTTHPKANTGENLTSLDGEISLLSKLKGVFESIGAAENQKR